MTVDREERAPMLGEPVLEDDGRPQEIIDDRDNGSVVHGRDFCSLLQAEKAARCVIEQTKVESLMRGSPLSSVSPPFLFGPEQHGRQEGPRLKAASIKTVLPHHEFGKP